MISGAARQRLIQLAGLAGAIVLFLYLALRHLTSQDIYNDEPWTARTAGMPVPDIVSERLRSGHLPLYFLLIRFIFSFPIPLTLPTLILPSIVLSLCGLLLFYKLARDLALRNWSILAAFLWAVHPFMLFFTRHARPFAGTLLLECAILVLISRCRPRASTQTIALLLLCGFTGALWNHLLLVIWAAVFFVLLSPAVRRQLDPRLLPISVAVIALHGAGIALCKYFSTRVGFHTFGLHNRPAAHDIGWAFLKAWGGDHIEILTPGWVWLFPALLAATALFAAIQLATKRFQDPMWAIIRICAIGPPLALLLVSLFWPALQARYLAIFLPALFLCLLDMMSRAKRWRELAIASALVIFVYTQFDRRKYDKGAAGFRPAVQAMERITQGSPELGISFIASAVPLFAQRPHRVIELEVDQNQPRLLQPLQQQLDAGGLVWEVNPEWFRQDVAEPVKAIIGKPVYEKRFRQLLASCLHEGQKLATGRCLVHYLRRWGGGITNITGAVL